MQCLLFEWCVGDEARWNLCSRGGSKQRMSTTAKRKKYERRSNRKIKGDGTLFRVGVIVCTWVFADAVEIDGGVRFDRGLISSAFTRGNHDRLRLTTHGGLR